MSIHNNSMKAYVELDSLGKRCRMVVKALDDLGRATDRVIKDHLRLSDMNSVRPRVTELLKLGILEECGTELCSLTNRTVRIVRLSNPSTDQMEIGFDL